MKQRRVSVLVRYEALNSEHIQEVLIFSSRKNAVTLTVQTEERIETRLLTGLQALNVTQRCDLNRLVAGDGSLLLRDGECKHKLCLFAAPRGSIKLI